MPSYKAHSFQTLGVFNNSKDTRITISYVKHCLVIQTSCKCQTTSSQQQKWRLPFNYMYSRPGMPHISTNTSNTKYTSAKILQLLRALVPSSHSTAISRPCACRGNNMRQSCPSSHRCTYYTTIRHTSLTIITKQVLVAATQYPNPHATRFSAMTEVVKSRLPTILVSQLFKVKS